MGQALFFAVLGGAAAVATAYGARDLRKNGRWSDLAVLMLALTAVLAGLVGLSALAAGLWPSGAPLEIRLPVAVALAVIGLMVVLATAGSAPATAGRVLTRAVSEGFVLIAFAAAVMADSAAALVIALAATVSVELLARARSRFVTLQQSACPASD